MRVSPFQFSYTLAVNDNKLSPYHRPNWFTHVPYDISNQLNHLSPVFVEPARIALMELLEFAFLNFSGTPPSPSIKVPPHRWRRCRTSCVS